MPRNDSNTRKIRNDIRLDFRELARMAGLSPKQRIIIARYMKNKLIKEVNTNE